VRAVRALHPTQGFNFSGDILGHIENRGRKAQNRKTKTDTNPIPDPNQYRRRCPDPNTRIQIEVIGTHWLPGKSEYYKLRLRPLLSILPDNFAP